jgi:hypothetical protein
LAGDPDARDFGVIVTAIAFVEIDAAGLDPCQRLQPGGDRPQDVRAFLLPNWIKS